ncbi:MAG: VWA domain-containing protein [Candidatus Babeliaceae bacterium]
MTIFSEQMVIVAPQYLYLFPLWILITVLIIKNTYKRAKIVGTLAAPVHQKILLRHFSLVRLWVKSLLLCFVIFLSAFALVRPQWGVKEKQVTSQGRDLLIALDVSRSMLAQDCMPHRLTCAKKKIKDIVYALHADRVGLILFSDTAFVQCPLTLDRAAFFLFLDAVNQHTLSEGSTALDRPIQKALEIFKRMPASQSRLLLIVTDGEDFSGQTQALGDLLHTHKVALWCLGIGTAQGAPIPLYDAQGNQKGHVRDKKGEVVISHFNEQLLRDLVKKCGGHYLHSTEDNQDIAAIFSWVERFEKQNNSEAITFDYEDRFYYCTGLSFISLVIHWLL